MSQTSSGCYTISLPGRDLADNLQRTSQGGRTGANSPSNKRAAPGAAFLHFSASLRSPNPPQPSLATGGEQQSKARGSPALGCFCSGRRSSAPLPVSAGQLLGTAPVRADAAAAGRDGSGGIGPGTDKAAVQQLCLAFPAALQPLTASTARSRARSRARSAAELPGFRGREIARDTREALLCAGTSSAASTSFAQVGRSGRGSAAERHVKSRGFCVDGTASVPAATRSALLQAGSLQTGKCPESSQAELALPARSRNQLGIFEVTENSVISLSKLREGQKVNEISEMKGV